MNENIKTKVRMFLKILWNRFAVFSILFLLIQQLIVASSTFWITYLSEAVVNHGHIYLYLTLFVASLFLVYIPGIFAGFNLEKAKSKAFFQYTALFSDKYKCIPEALSDKHFQAEKEPWLTNESSKTIEEAYSVGYDSLSTALNTLLNVLAICIAIDSKMMIGYIISFLILPIVSHWYKNKIAEAAIKLQQDRKSMSQTLLSGWDNIIIGNIYNFSIWWKEYLKRWSNYNHSSASAVLIMQIASASATIFTLIPVAIVFLWVFFTTSDVAKLAALIATLPRQIQIIQHFEILSTYAMHWHSVIAKLKALVSTITTPPFNKEQLVSRIQTKEITISINNQQKEFTSVDHFIETINAMPYGRITIRGRNGSGKTTLINLLKKELGNRAYYLPTTSKLFFEKTLEESLSTGQRIKAYLEELTQTYQKSIQPHNHIFLFDEWDANLDKNNVMLISNLLDDFSKEYCVIEISHR